MMIIENITDQDFEERLEAMENARRAAGDYELRDFTIVSTRADTLLFFCSGFQKVVIEAIKRIMEKIPYKDRLSLIANKSYIEIEDQDTRERYFEMLDNYDSRKDIEEFTFW